MVVKLGASNYPEHPVYIYYQNKKAEGKHYSYKHRVTVASIVYKLHIKTIYRWR